jgi:hypothetical protein
MAEAAHFAYRRAMRARLIGIVLALIAGGASAGETACWFDNGAVVVPAAFGDIAGDFILDLSAPHSQLHVTVAESAGIGPPTARAALRLAGETLGGLEMTVTDLDARSTPFVAGVAGVIGADAFAGWVVSLQTSPCRVALSRRAGRLVGGRRLPLRRIAGAWAVEAAISDGVTSRRGWFAIDTGGPGMRIADARFTRQPPPGAAESPARLRALSLGGRLFEQTPAGLMADAPPGLAGSIGEAAWSAFRMRIDAGRGWLDLAPTASR